jgi:Fe2+ or Zn2+ uptake regulation protein
MSADWQVFRYIRRNVRTGQARYAERGFISRHTFLGELSAWNDEQPENWQYEAVRPVLPTGYSHDLLTVRDCGAVEESR